MFVIRAASPCNVGVCFLVAAFMTAELACAVNLPDRGQAIALNNCDWKAWLQFVLDNHSCQLYVILWLTGAFALRCTEARLCRTPKNNTMKTVYITQIDNLV